MYARESQDHFQVLASHRAPLRRETQSLGMDWGILCTQPLDREAETHLTDVPCLSSFKFLCNSSCFSNVEPPSTRAAVPTEDFLQLQRTLNCLKRAMERNGDPCHWDQKRPCSRISHRGANGETGGEPGSLHADNRDGVLIKEAESRSKLHLGRRSGSLQRWEDTSITRPCPPPQACYFPGGRYSAV